MEKINKPLKETDLKIAKKWEKNYRHKQRKQKKPTLPTIVIHKLNGIVPATQKQLSYICGLMLTSKYKHYFNYERDKTKLSKNNASKMIDLMKNEKDFIIKHVNDEIVKPKATSSRTHKERKNVVKATSISEQQSDVPKYKPRNINYENT